MNDSDYDHLSDRDEAVLVDIFGPDWMACVTPEGADRLVSLIEGRRAEKPDPIEDGDECPICNEEILNSNDILSDMVGESISVEKLCVEELDDQTGEVHSIIHFDDERVDGSRD